MICLRSECGGWKADVIGGLGSNPVGGLVKGLRCVCGFFFFFFTKPVCVFWVLMDSGFSSHLCSGDASCQYLTTRSVCLDSLSSLRSLQNNSLFLVILNIIGTAVLLHLFQSDLWSFFSTMLRLSAAVKKLLFVCYFSHFHSSLFPLPVSTSYQQLCYHTSENPALNLVFSKPEVYPVSMVPKKIEVM